MTYNEALDLLREAPERVQKVDFRLTMHLNAAPGGTSVLTKHDAFHRLTQTTRTPKRKGGGYGRGRVSWTWDGADEEVTAWSTVVVQIGEFIRDGRYSEAGRQLAAAEGPDA